MDSSTKRRLALGFAANWVSKLSATVVQLVQVPVFLHAWPVPLYGEWMILNSLPAYLSFSNVGFGNVAGNEMAMRSARGDLAGALGVFQSCCWLIVGICGATIAGLGVGLYFFPVGRLLRLHAISETDAKWIAFYLGCSVLLSQLEQLLQSAYRCVGRYAYGTFVKSCLSLAAFASTICAVMLGAGARRTALVFAGANAVCTVVLCGMVKRDVAWIEFGWRYARWSEVRRLTRPAVAFMAFPVGAALNLQGTLMAVGWALGPVAVVVFGTARTVSRVALQMVQMVNNTFWPEMSASFGKGDTALTRALHRRACQMALVLALGVVVGTITVGPWFLSHWTGGHVPPSRGLLSVLLLGVVVYALWSTSATLLFAVNRHQRLAVYYLLAMGTSCVLCYFAALRWGLVGAAGALVVAEVMVNLYVLPAVLQLAEDRFSGFFASLFVVPKMRSDG
jgi:O-antigen/teichoic acid export membrane protein